MSKDQHQLQKTKRFIRNFLRVKNSGEFLIFLFFLLVAFVFWYLMTMTNEYEMTFSPKLRLENVPNDMVVIESLPERIDVVLKDKGDKLVEYKARGLFHELLIDFRQYTNVKGAAAIYGAELNKLISSKLALSTQVVSVSVDTLQYYVASSRGVKVPVKIAGRIEADNQFGIQRVSIEPDSVTVYASSAYLDSLKFVYTPTLYYDGLTDSVSEVIMLDAGIHGVKYEPSEVCLSVAVSPYVTKVVEVPIDGYLFPYGMSLKTFPSKATIVFRVSLDDYGKVSEDDFILQVHYSQVQDNSSGKVGIRLVSFPDCIHNVRVEPDEVDYLIELNALPVKD